MIFYTVQEAAKILRINRIKMAQLIKEGKIKAIDISYRGSKNKYYRIPKEELEKFIYNSQD